MMINLCIIVAYHPNTSNCSVGGTICYSSYGTPVQLACSNGTPTRRLRRDKRANTGIVTDPLGMVGRVKVGFP